MGLTFIDIIHFSIYDKNIQKYVLCLSRYKDKHIIKLCIVGIYFFLNICSLLIFLCAYVYTYVQECAGAPMASS